MDRNDFPHLNDSQYESVRKMAGIFGMDALQSLVAATPAEQVERVNAFDTYERGLIAHVRGSMQPPMAEAKPSHQKPLRLKVNPYEGKEGENLHFWVREVELAMDAALISTEQLRVAFAVANLSGRAKRWAYTREATTPGCFASWAQLCEQLRAAFLPANYEYRQRSRSSRVNKESVSCTNTPKGCGSSLHPLWENPLHEQIKVTVFMDGLRVGPARTQLFRVQTSTLEEAIQVALQEEYSHRQPPPGPVPMELGLAEQQDIRCYGCGRLGHMKQACPAGGQRKRFPPRPLGLKGRWQKPRPRGQGNGGDQ
ncbi:hypothetical protein PC129_g19730 [Phytophthora cactorum]|uniref:CCHC-type domain-containing protein n=1 Tax=Phytophthora cactorum TaxID=29920 RepID=A0A8T1HA67_9STRA|nr:hypothetical protein PC129_g19730 [Phytophthora cactorum]